MTGLDYTRADLDTRSAFAVTKERSQRLVAAIKAGGIVGGAVVVSTCNRTELYASIPGIGVTDFSLTRALCEALEQDYTSSARYFIELTDDEALEHLSRVGAGLDSQILGDDQIITQIREALELSRAAGCTDSYLETFFRVAIQSAKAIKTNVILRALGAASVPQGTVETLKALTDLSASKVVVIGNGVIGRHVATLLLDEGAQVTVTIRQYHRGLVQVPPGARTIGYIDRYQVIDGADIVISATTSNHFTVRYDDLIAVAEIPRIVVDLAVPRDVEAEIAEIDGVLLLTVDDISSESRSLSNESLGMVQGIVEKNIARYHNWRKHKQVAEALGRPLPKSVATIAMEASK